MESLNKVGVSTNKQDLEKATEQHLVGTHMNKSQVTICDILLQFLTEGIDTIGSYLAKYGQRSVSEED